MRLQPLYPDHPELADKETLIKLYWSGQAIYNHLADEKKCAEMFDRLMEFKKDIHVMQWASIVNHVAVAYADTFQMEKALCEFYEGDGNSCSVKICKKRNAKIFLWHSAIRTEIKK